MKRFRMLTAIVMVMSLVFCFSGQLWAGEAGQVNINTASAEELATLKKVGLKTANRIIEYRSSVSMFKAPAEVMNVKGIGEKIYELNKDRIVVGDNVGPAQKTDKTLGRLDSSPQNNG